MKGFFSASPAVSAISDRGVQIASMPRTEQQGL